MARGLRYPAVRKVLVVYCHPNPKSFAHAVMTAVTSGLRAGGANVELLDLYAEGFDPALVVDETRRRRELDKVAETERHRALLTWCDVLVFVYPMWWGGFPAMLKGFVDRVIVSGVAYTYEGRPENAVFPRGLLRGKAVHLFYTLDAPALVGLFDPGFVSMYLAVFWYCGVRTVRRHFLARLKRTTPARREAWLREVEQRARRIGAGR